MRMNFRTVIVGLMLTVLMIGLWTVMGCANTTNPPTTIPTAIQQEQQTHDSLAALLFVSETVYADAVLFGVVPVKDQALAAVADKAANDALAAMQTAINAGNTNGFQIALGSFNAALADLNPIIHKAQLAHKAKLKAAKK